MTWPVPWHEVLFAKIIVCGEPALVYFNSADHLKRPTQRENQSFDIHTSQILSVRKLRKVQFCKSLVSLLKKEDGPTAVEYAVMLALIIVVCIAAISALGSNANDTFSLIGSTVKVSSPG